MLNGSDREWLRAVIKAVPDVRDARRRQALIEQTEVLEHLFERVLNPIGTPHYWDYTATVNHDEAIADALVNGGVDGAGNWAGFMSFMEYLNMNPPIDRFKSKGVHGGTVTTLLFARPMSSIEVEFEMKLLAYRPATIRETLATYPDIRKRHESGMETPFRLAILGTVIRGPGLGALVSPVLQGHRLEVGPNLDLWESNDWFPAVRIQQT